MYIEKKEKKITLDSILRKVLDAYKASNIGREAYTPVMDNLTNEINNLVKDL